MDSVAVPREREETDVRSAAPVLEARVGVDADAATSSSSSTIVIGTRRHVGFGAEDPGSGATGTSRGVYSYISTLKSGKGDVCTVRGAGLGFVRSA
jgi:hypothetical protein